MRLSVAHRTVYRYSEPIVYAIQTLRLEPRPYEGLAVMHWRVEGEDARELPNFIDGLGNVVHTQSIDRRHREAVVTVTGEVETRRGDGVVVGAPEPMPPVFFLRQTPLTEPDDAIRELAIGSAKGGDMVTRLHGLMSGVRERLDYRAGETDSTTPAAAALAQGFGVCQDHAHVFVAAARSIDIPARYVSGYLWTGIDAHAADASHAWAEAYVTGFGWVGFDPANRVCPTENYIRIAVGLDYSAAAPVRGLRRGPASESLKVEVQVRRQGGDQ